MKGGHPGRQLVLIVDDEKAVRDTISECLTLDGFEVAQASDGLDALLQVKRLQPRVVILDLMMPRLGGLEALKRIRAFDPQISIVVITGFSDPELRRQALSLGASAFLLKPFGFEELLAAINGPASTSQSATAPSATRPPKTPEARPARKILVVDDDPQICEVLKEHFTLLGYDVETALDGVVALRTVVADPPDVVLLDINLPRLGGLEALAAMRAIVPDVQVIIVSGQVDLERAKQSLAYGAFDYITKPFGLPYLTETVEAAISAKEMETQPSSQTRPTG
jgi:DNA-binding response OmpR family regulator